MTGTVPDTHSSTDIARFFADREIDAFCIADVSRINAPAGRHPRDLLPASRTIIIFGAVMTDRLFFGTGQEQAFETERLTEILKSAALGLRDQLAQDGSASEAILPSLPMKIEGGRLRGRLSLKHCAADAGFGTMGDNTLLLHPVHGNRLGLAAVITEKEIAPSPTLFDLPSCTHCSRCAAACSAGAIADGAVVQTACRNLTDYVPPCIQPLSWRLMRGRWSSRFVTFLLNGIAPFVGIRSTCTACMTACPYFHKGNR